MGQLKVQLLKWADVAKKQSFQQKDDFTRRFSSFQTLVFSCVSNMAASKFWLRFLLVSALALGYSSRIPPATWPQEIKIIKFQPPRRGSTTLLVILWLLLLWMVWSNSGEFTHWRQGSGNLPLFPGFGIVKDFWTISHVGLPKSWETPLRAQYFWPIWTKFLCFFLSGGCEVGLLEKMMSI